MLKVTAVLSTPIILSPDAHLTLDSVLHHILMERNGQNEDMAIKDMPLEKCGSVFAASAAFFPCEAYYSQKIRVAALRGDNDAGSDRFKPNAGRGKDKSYGPFQVVRNTHEVGNCMDKYQSIVTPRVFWYANGDADHIKELLSGIVGLGRRCTSGHGQIDRILIEMTDNDYSLVLPDGRPARPIPIDEWTGIKDDLRIETVSCIPPYYATEPRLCVMQDTRFLNFASRGDKKAA